MKLPLTEFEFKTLSLENVPEILDLQDRVIASLTDPTQLRKNTVEMFTECVTAPNLTIGVYHGNLLIALGVLYYPTGLEEDLSHLLQGVDINGKKSAKYKLIMVDKEYRGNGLQCALGKRFEAHAKATGVTLLCATVSPDNKYSENNMLKLGYTLNATLPKYGSIRNLFYKFI